MVWCVLLCFKVFVLRRARSRSSLNLQLKLWPVLLGPPPPLHHLLCRRNRECGPHQSFVSLGTRWLGDSRNRSPTTRNGNQVCVRSSLGTSLWSSCHPQRSSWTDTTPQLESNIVIICTYLVNPVLNAALAWDVVVPENTQNWAFVVAAFVFLRFEFSNKTNTEEVTI